MVVSHDRYFVERVADNVFALDAIGGIRHLPGGIDQYLAEFEAPARAAFRAALRGRRPRQPKAGSQIRRPARSCSDSNANSSAATTAERELHEQMAASATDHGRLGDLTAAAEATRRGARPPRVGVAGGRHAARTALEFGAIATTQSFSQVKLRDPRPATGAATRQLRSHWPLALIVLVGAVMRVLTMVGYPPALLFPDSWGYIATGLSGASSDCRPCTRSATRCWSGC